MVFWFQLSLLVGGAKDDKPMNALGRGLQLPVDFINRVILVVIGVYHVKQIGKAGDCRMMVAAPHRYGSSFVFL